MDIILARTPSVEKKAVEMNINVDTAKISVSDGSEKNNRALLEKGVKYITGLSTDEGKEHTHYRRSGVNQVLAKLAKEHGTTYIINFARILNSENRALLIGRIMQNVRIFKKYKVPIKVCSLAKVASELRSESDLEAFGRVLGV